MRYLSQFWFALLVIYLFSREVNKELRAMIANEEEKRSHLRSIIEKLKSQKNEHSSVIDNLISENDQLSREVLESEREVRTFFIRFYLFISLRAHLFI